jgi:hypothetical protein
MERRDDDGYGRYWDYRVFSTLETEPDSPYAGRRRLEIHVVQYTGRPKLYPQRDDICAIHHEEQTPGGNTIEELQLDLHRMLEAADKPALILAEWIGYLDQPAAETSEDTARRVNWLTGHPIPPPPEQAS